jgi:nitrogen regulatory protein PII
VEDVTQIATQVTELEQAIRIRTGETGAEAV